MTNNNIQNTQNNTVMGQAVAPNYNGMNSNYCTPQNGAYVDPFTGTMQNTPIATGDPNALKDGSYQTFTPDRQNIVQPNVQSPLQNVPNMNERTLTKEEEDKKLEFSL